VAEPEYTWVTCSMCEERFEFNKPQEIVNTDGTKAESIENVVVLFVTPDNTDYYPRFYCRNLCAAEYARVNDIRLMHPSSFPARYYEAAEEEPDPEQRAVVMDGKQTNQVPTLARRSRLS
jgi:hypothetical protein